MFRPTRLTLDTLDDRFLPGYVLGASPEPPAALVRESAESSATPRAWAPPVEPGNAGELMKLGARADGLEFSLNSEMEAPSLSPRTIELSSHPSRAVGLNQGPDLSSGVVTAPRGEDRDVSAPGRGLSGHGPSVWPPLQAPVLGQGLLEMLTGALGDGPTVSPSPGPAAIATYLFGDHLNPEQESAPALIPHDPLGFNRFETAGVFGQERTVYRMDGTTTDRDNAGLQLDTTGLLTPNYYSLEMVFEFVEGTGTWRKMIDLRDRQSDNGMYLNTSNRLELWPVQPSGTRPVPVNQFRHLVVTNETGSVQVYLDGTREFSIASTTVMNIDNPANVLRLFVDDEATSAGEYADSRISLLRVYDSILNADAVALLAKDPFAY